jgi:chaperonin GroEL
MRCTQPARRSRGHRAGGERAAARAAALEASATTTSSARASNRRAVEGRCAIAENAGVDGAIVVDKVKSGKAFGFNAQTEEYEDS